MTFRSVRSRVVAGTIFWAAGVYLVGHVVALSVFTHFAHAIRVAHWTLLTVVAVLCIAAGLSGVRSGLSPLKALRWRVEEVREGRVARIEGEHPTEVEPLVEEINALLEDRDRRVANAIARAGDLAHGLKTPLAVLCQAAERAREEGQGELAVVMEQQTERMRRIVERHLAHARSAVSGTTPGRGSRVADSVDALVRTLRTLYADQGLTIETRASGDETFRGQAIDFEEMLGNVLDNACKWATSRVVVTASRTRDRLTIDVDDDGAGLDEETMQVVLHRGVRADELAPGSGFGLAIARELAELHGGTLVLGRSPEGGLRASLRLPGGGEEEAGDRGA